MKARNRGCRLHARSCDFIPVRPLHQRPKILKSPFKVRKGFWSHQNNQKQFLDAVGRDLGMTQLSDWYRITRRQIIERGGGSLFCYYASLSDMLKTLYPEHVWNDAKFVSAGAAPRGHWQEDSNLVVSLEAAEQKLGMKEPDDWYTVTMTDLKEVGFPYYLGKLKLAQLLSQKYPEHKWEKVLLLKGRFAPQRRLERTVASLFPDTKILFNARKEGNIINPETNEYLELDVYLPSLQLAFEYQDKHHYIGTQYSYTPLDQIRERDAKKRELAKNSGISLVVVPCWWDGREQSLIATIKEIRPELFDKISDKGLTPIPKEIPPNFFEKTKGYYVEDIGVPTAATFMTLTSVDPTNWWVFEKYDGVRGFWNPLKKGLFSRTGHRFNIPQEISDSMPSDMFLDGEIWFGRDNFHEAMKLSSRAEESTVDWPKFKYMVFDVPLQQTTYAERYDALVKRFGGSVNGYIEVALKVACKGMEHLEKVFQDIVDEGGEGIILRDPVAPYEPGRSNSYLKHKKFRDAEAKVVEALGPYQWLCELPNGITFTAVPGTSELLKRTIPKPGDIVSFKHHGYLPATRKPKLPALYRIRSDITWEDIVNNWKDPKPKRIALPMKRATKDTKPKGYWRSPEHRRKFFLEFAASMGFDPLVPDNWENITRRQVLAHKGGASLLKGKKGYRGVLQSAFPELKLKKSEKTLSIQWKDIRLVRRYFDEYAKEKGFDPLDPENWYSITLTRILLKPGGYAIRSLHGGLMNALQLAYPELSFERWKDVIENKKESRWADERFCRTFFDDFAKEKGFDPLVPENWYSLNMARLLEKKGAQGVGTHNGGFRKALTHAYPEVRFTKWQAAYL